MVSKNVKAIGLLILTALVTSCSNRPPIDYSDLKLATVKGRVTLDGEPLAGATIDFEIAKVLPVLASSAKTDDNGRYEMIYDTYAKGVTPGKKVVRIYGGRFEEGVGAQAGGVPAKYNKDSELERVVEPNGNHTFNFDLESS